ncbi:hypothetical protein I553_0782 [Mycobacterium xenopi 4042]|uniref:Uncharacterized protein n=1 Tax=Mycobacterium xenopi 4042 TaxID=1299334 RepID=X7YJD7_MYCXE|nr:hypothetical protein I553_0782 [Mycobacterium xenopi 4042]
MGSRRLARRWAIATVSNQRSRAMVYSGLSLQRRLGGRVDKVSGTVVRRP